jgi:hypothetical protein
MKNLILCGMALVGLSACGGGSDDSLNIEGTWKGSYALESVFAETPLYALIRTGGPAILYDKTGLIYVIPTTPTGGDINTTTTLYPPYGFVFTSGQAVLPVSMKATASSGSISGNLTLQGGVASFDLSRLTAFSGSPSIVAGVWSGAYIGSQDVAFHVTASGAITGDDVFSCSFKGQITQVSSGENLFDVQLTSTGPAPLCGHSFKGLAYESSTDEVDQFGHAAGTYYYVVAYDAQEALAAELKVQ